MKNKTLLTALMFALPLALATTAVLFVHPPRANGEQNLAQGMEVKVDNFSFSPATLTVPVNSTVSWVNKDDVPHVVAGNDGSFKSKALDTDDKYSYTFTKAGTYSYYCPIHPKMVGKVIVY